MRLVTPMTLILLVAVVVLPASQAAEETNAAAPVTDTRGVGAQTPSQEQIARELKQAQQLLREQADVLRAMRLEMELQGAVGLISPPMCVAPTWAAGWALISSRFPLAIRRKEG